MPPADFRDSVRRAKHRFERMQRSAFDDGRHGLETVLGEWATALEELEVANEELRTQTDELRAAEALVEAERDKYGELFLGAPDAYLVTDPHGVILEANDSAGQLFGREPQRLPGKPLAALVDADMRRVFRREVAAVEARAVREWETRFDPAGGSAFTAVVRVRGHEPRGAKRRLHWIVRDVTERRRVDDAVDRMGSAAWPEPTDVAAAAQAVADAAARTAAAIDNMDGATAVLLDGPGAPFVASTDDTATALVAVDERHGGPVARVARSGHPLNLLRLAGGGTLPDYRSVARDLGVEALLCQPLQVAERTLGVLLVYSRDAGAVTPEAPGAVRHLAEIVAHYLGGAIAFAGSRALAEQLQLALDSRVVIEQAKGMLAERRGISPDEAFDGLRRYARNHNKRLHAVAEAVVRDDLEP